ncbi:amid-like mitochondrial oxidoreductase [Colletotrichum musicola]|uniref:Amid-like mitochondrial oxidoreductase n=1 Tax=Colletotrichum musicola TaxID=2175873 RepID=A0A8H6JIK1_9PEZI|nr:amid-like mitochondrial oxidoreductase [Colletotrichum musicola]
MAQTPTAKNIVILGGSYAGVSTAHYLLRHVLPQLPAEDKHRIVLVSASSQVMCRPACPRALISHDMFDQAKLFVDIQSVFQQYSKNTFRFVHGAATALDLSSRTVTVTLAGKADIKFIGLHALVIATGASTPSPLLGLNRDSDALRQTWNKFREALPQAKNIVIAGGGPAGVETVGELGEYLNGRPGWLGRSPEKPKVSITLVTSGSELLPALRPSIARKAEGYLAELGVTVLKNTRLESVSPAGAGIEDVAARAKLSLSDGQVLEADLYIPATGMRPNTNFIPSDAGILAPDGRVATNPATLRVDAAGPRVYALGDVSSYARPAVHNVLAAVPVLCANIKRDLLRTEGATPSGDERVFEEDVRETQMVPIGKGAGVGAGMGYALPGFVVRLVKGRDYWLWTTERLWSGQQWAKES